MKGTDLHGQRRMGALRTPGLVEARRDGVLYHRSIGPGNRNKPHLIVNSFPEFVDLIFPEFVNEGWHDNTAMHWDMAGENGFQMSEMG